ncbi:MAG: protein-L-isoaspartate(D-aspartate) O-methyltransferase [Spirochaetia bacterium]|nr:protein-L-isoaspartate(D-aspartate) O-methyltransferase [Spirochaetia bacterium]
MDFEADRLAMISEIQRHAKESSAYTGITHFSENVLKSMMEVPRHEFVPDSQKKFSYDDSAQSIGAGQTISQPFIVALMCQALELKKSDRVLEIGTGCGYHAAVLSRLCHEVITVEVIPELAALAAKNLQPYSNVQVYIRDGHGGFKEKAPFQAISVAAAADAVPDALIEQLAPEGKMIIPLQNSFQGGQNLALITKRDNGSIYRKNILPVIFVPFVKK